MIDKTSNYRIRLKDNKLLLECMHITEQGEEWNPCSSVDMAKILGVSPETETYPENWAKVTLMVSPDAKEIHAIGGDRVPGDGDMPYLGFERILNRINDAETNDRKRQP